jgi:hypothetical protein
VKSTLTTIIGLFAGSLLTVAQWTNNPANPTVVSNTTCYQQSVQQVPDGAGGFYVFWKDSRISCNSGSLFDVYGQHYSANGEEQWTSGGKMILNYAGSITSFSVQRYDDTGEMIIGAVSAGPDSLRFQSLDPNGNKLWPADLLVGRADGCVGLYILGFESFSFLRDNTGYVVMMSPVYCGGSNGNRITRFNSSGNLTGLFGGEPEGNQYYIGARGFKKTYDNSGDLIIHYTNGNGSGAHASCLRVNLSGDTVWAPIDVLAGTNGLNYQFEVLNDGSGIYVFFETFQAGTNNDILLRKLNNDGTWAWGGATIPVAAADGGQGGYHVTQDDQNLYVVWTDSRLGATCGYYRIFAQCIDKVTGAALWATNGVQVFDQCSYIPTPKCIVSPEGQLLVSQLSTSLETGFNMNLLDTDGTVVWDQPFVACQTTFNPFYGDYVMGISDQNVAVSWARFNPGGGADGIHIARIYELPNPCPEDLNGDGFVNTIDLLLFISFYGCSSGCTDGDLNGDTVVNTVDLLIFISAYGTACL